MFAAQINQYTDASITSDGHGETVAGPENPCSTCRGEILANELRVIYCPSPDLEPKYKDKPIVYKKMAEKTDGLYHNISSDCIPPPQLGDGTPFVQNVVSRHSLIVEIAFKAKRFKESHADYHKARQDAIEHALNAFRLAGHDVEDG